MCCFKPGEGAKPSYHKHLMEWTHFETDVYVSSQVEMPTPSELTYDASSPLLLISHYSHPMKWEYRSKGQALSYSQKIQVSFCFQMLSWLPFVSEYCKKELFSKVNWNTYLKSAQVSEPDNKVRTTIQEGEHWI